MRIERAPGASQPLGDSVVSTLHVGNAAGIAEALSGIDGLDVLGRGDGTVRIRHRASPTIAGGDPAQYLESTWVVDFDEPAVRALVDSTAAGDGAQPAAAELARFVFGHIAHKTYARSFDLASQVAAGAAGDCTEHAVFLTALARAHGHPARVVVGSLVVETPGELQAFGHAWTEVHDGERWRIYDATIPHDEAGQARLRYTPVGLLRDEGPGYALSMLEVAVRMPTRITEVADSP
ncbi:MAG: transglutaminase-like domain-containing protein [Proteobacteria bacterium]|nr:transglutaminase-like domain-containing protein [Pseudomonadota bacterium]